MKKIVALGAIAALACGMAFADEPAIDIKVAEFTGNAQVKWGVDLDAGQHGFSNSDEAKLKVNLWNEGTKETTADDAIGGGSVWAEIKIKGKAANIENGALKDGTASLETAKLHIGENFYVNIKKGDLKHGEYKPDVAIHGDSPWIKSYGFGWPNGIEAGWDAEAFKFFVDFRSYKATATGYTSCYGIELGAELKDSLVPGLTAAAGFDVNLSQDYKDATSTKIEGETDGTNAVSTHAAAIIDWDKNLNTDHAIGSMKNYRGMGYSAKAAYKFAIDDTYYVKPSVGFRGEYDTATAAGDKAYTKNENELAFGVLFGWGAQADAKAGVPFLDEDSSKKVTPGVSVAAYIPLAKTTQTGDNKTITYDALKALIVPSFYLGSDLVPNLSAAVYSEIGLLSYVDPADRSKTEGTTRTVKGSVKEDETLAFALAAGVKYAITLDNDATVTPSAGFRYVNGSYVANKTLLVGKASDIFKSNLGFQSKKVKADELAKATYKADFFNLKIGCDFGGFINNTTFSVNYSSANLLNAIGTEDTNPTYAKDTKYYNVKAGQLDVGCKISF